MHDNTQGHKLSDGQDMKKPIQNVLEENQKTKTRICAKCFGKYNLTNLINREIDTHTLNKNNCVCMFGRDNIILCKNCNELFDNILKNLNDFFVFIPNIKRIDCEIVKQDLD